MVHAAPAVINIVVVGLLVAAEGQAQVTASPALPRSHTQRGAPASPSASPSPSPSARSQQLRDTEVAVVRQQRRGGQRPSQQCPGHAAGIGQSHRAAHHCLPARKVRVALLLGGGAVGEEGARVGQLVRAEWVQVWQRVLRGEGGDRGELVGAARREAPPSLLLLLLLLVHAAKAKADAIAKVESDRLAKLAAEQEAKDKAQAERDAAQKPLPFAERRLVEGDTR